jgi:hypothetical protein
VAQRTLQALTVLVVVAGIALAAAQARRTSGLPAATEPKIMQRITIMAGDRPMTATLYDNPTARAFAATLPFAVTMHDHRDQEKAGPLPRPLSTGGPAQRDFTAGEIGYWSPTADIAVYYRSGDGLPSPGIIMIGKVDGDLMPMKAKGNLRVRFARAE